MMRSANQRRQKSSTDVTGYNEYKIRSHWLLIMSRGSVPPPVNDRARHQRVRKPERVSDISLRCFWVEAALTCPAARKSS